METNEMRAKSLTKENKGRYIVVDVPAVGVTKVKIAHVNALEEDIEETNRFCIITEETKLSGHYLGSIEAYAVDKGGHIFIIVKPLVHIAFDYFDEAWDFLIDSDALWTNYGNDRQNNAHLNTDAVYDAFGYADSINELGERAVKEAILKDIVSGKHDLVELTSLLTSPFPCEKAVKKLAELIANDKDAFAAKYPFLYKRLITDRNALENTCQMFEKWHETYVCLGLSGAEDMVDESEAVLRYYKVKNEEAKAAKKAARKAEKQAANQ